MWNRFKEYTKNQVLELCENYGKLDILWFDAGWVCEHNGQDIDLGGIVDEARKIQPWVLSVDLRSAALMRTTLPRSLHSGRAAERSVGELPDTRRRLYVRIRRSLQIPA